MGAMETSAQHNPDQGRFEIRVDDDVACLDYQERGQTLVLTHTWVPPVLRGQGLAGKLTEAALTYARQAKKTIDPQCSFVAAYLDQHPEYSDLRAR
jgi:uncharacterized protein